jgi:hypothetical protein
MKTTSEGETLGIYLEGEGEGEIHRGMDLSEVGEENPPRILKNRRREALVTGSHLLVAGEELRREKEKKRPKGCGRLFYRPGTRVSDMSDTDRIYPANFDLAELGRIYPMISVTGLEKVLEISNFLRI